MGKPLIRFTQPLAPHSTMSPLQVARLLLPLFLSISSSEPIEPRQEGLYQPFTLIAASPIHLQSINANNFTFWIGKPTSSICLTKNITIVQCPQGNITAFTWGGYAAGLVSELHLYTVSITLSNSQNVNVPAGQDVFVARNGALGFSRAHGDWYPDGATGGPFKATFDTVGSVLGQLSFSGNGSTGWLACPVAEEGPWQILAAVEGLKDGAVPGGCVYERIGFDALTAEYNSTEPAAFQYE